MSKNKSISLFSSHSHTLPIKKLFYILLASVLIIMAEEVFHLLIELIHYCFEGFELLLEELIEHFFGLSKTESQFYVFYLLIAIGAWLFFILVRITPAVYRRLKATSCEYCIQQRERLSDFWNQLEWYQKTLFFTVYLPLALYLGSFFVM